LLDGFFDGEDGCGYLCVIGVRWVGGWCDRTGQLPTEIGGAHDLAGGRKKKKKKKKKTNKKQKKKKKKKKRKKTKKKCGGHGLSGEEAALKRAGDCRLVRITLQSFVVYKRDFRGARRVGPQCVFPEPPPTPGWDE